MIPPGMATALLEARTSAEAAQVILERGARRTAGALSAAVLLLSPDGRELSLLGQVGYAPEQLDPWRRFVIEKNSIPVAAAAHSGRPIFLRDRDEWARRFPDPDVVPMLDRYGGVSWAALPLTVRGGRVVGVLGMTFASGRAFDAAEQAFLCEMAGLCALALDRAGSDERAQEAQYRLAFLARASTVLASSLNYDDTLQTVARLAVPELADWAAVDMLGPGGLDDLRGLRRLAVAHKDPEKVRLVREALRRYPPDPGRQRHPLLEVLKTGEPVFLPDVPDAVLEAAAQDAEHLAVMRLIGFRSYLCVPIRSRGRTLGAVTLVASRESGRVLGPEAVDMAEELARRAAVAVENAQLYAAAQAEIAEREAAQRAVARAAEEQRRFFRDVLASVTDGRLSLCSAPGELPVPLPNCADGTVALPAAESLGRFRAAVVRAAEKCGLSRERVNDFLTGASEAAMNAVHHGGGGEGRVCCAADGSAVQAWVMDHGAGIDTSRLPEATLWRGRSPGGGGFGHGFWLMLQTCDRVHLLTGPTGTTVMVEVERDGPAPRWP